MTQKQLERKLRKIALSLIEAREEMWRIYERENQVDEEDELLSRDEFDNLAESYNRLTFTLSALGHLSALEELLDIDGSPK